MPCYGCKKPFRDKVQDGYGVARSTCYSLCYDCMCKSLQIYESDPQDLINLYTEMKRNGLHIPEELIQDQLIEAEIRMLDPADRMFNPRG